MSSVKATHKRQKKGQDRSLERTEVIQGHRKILDFIQSRYANITDSIDACFDYGGPSHVTTTVPIWQELLNLEKREVKVRFLTDVRKDNIKYCNKLLALKTSEIRHLDGVKGNYQIADRRECFEHIVNKDSELPSHVIFTTVKGIVDTRQYLFDDLWNRATAAEFRMKEIEEGIVPDVIETIKEPSETISLAYRIIKSANDEILVMFHTANAMFRHKKSGGIDLLIENVIKKKTRVKILVPIEDKIQDVIQRLQQVNGIEIRNIESPMRTKMTILVVDRKYSLVVELRDDTKENLEEAIGLATYSNRSSTVLSYASIFDTLWKQSELRLELMNISIAQREFINNAAHELRNPIQPILGLSDILQHSDKLLIGDRDNKARQQKEMIDIIARNAQRLQILTEDILDVTKIDSNTLSLNRRNFILTELINKTVQDYIAEIRNFDKYRYENVTLSFLSSEDLRFMSVFADENRIQQVICNLIDNSLKFTDKGFVTIAVEVDNEHAQIIVRVKDTGKGIDTDILPKLFTKFVTRSDKGTGLGLYICKGIIEAHKGRIWAENNSDSQSNNNNNNNNCMGDRGATFSFSIPLLRT